MPAPLQETRRLFFALVPPSTLRREVVQAASETLPVRDGLRLYRAADLHLTLHFLGPFPVARLATLEKVFQQEVRGLGAPELRVTGTGGFPDLNSPRVYWAGVEEATSHGRLAALQNRVLQAGLCMGWRPARAELGRPFRPHLTLARGQRDASYFDATSSGFGDLRFDRIWLPEEVALVESRPEEPEERYRVIASAPLWVHPG